MHLIKYIALFMVLNTTHFSSIAGDGVHKFYVSNTIVEWNQRTNNVEISCKLFTDDLEKVLSAQSENPLNIGESNESQNAGELIEAYVRKNFRLSINDQNITFRYVGKEVENDLIYVYYEFTPTPSWNVMIVEDTLFIDQYPDQKNIVDIRMSGWSHSVVLTKEKPKDTLFH